MNKAKFSGYTRSAIYILTCVYSFFSIIVISAFNPSLTSSILMRLAAKREKSVDHKAIR